MYKLDHSSFHILFFFFFFNSSTNDYYYKPIGSVGFIESYILLKNYIIIINTANFNLINVNVWVGTLDSRWNTKNVQTKIGI